MMKIQIAMNQKKKTSMVHKTFPNDHSVASIYSSSLPALRASSVRVA